MRRNYWKKMLDNVRKCSLYEKNGEFVSLSTTLIRMCKEDGRKIKYCYLTEQDIVRQWNSQNGLCFWLGVHLDPDLLYESGNMFTPSVDRKHPNLDYTPDNIIIVTRFANLARNATPFDATRALFEKAMGVDSSKFITNFMG